MFEATPIEIQAGLQYIDPDERTDPRYGDAAIPPCVPLQRLAAIAAIVWPELPPTHVVRIGAMTAEGTTLSVIRLPRKRGPRVKKAAEQPVDQDGVPIE